MTQKKKPSAKTFPIVGLGASAGGLEALKAFFAEAPQTSGIAYIVVVHITRKQPSMMPGLLQKVSPIPVATAKDGEKIEPDHVYVIPPNKDIAIFKGRIQLLEMLPKGVSHPIDSFLRSLAQDQGHQAAAVILSGTGTDGTMGVKEIKGRDGLILVQSEESASYDGMPRSAISTGLVDKVLPPEKMAQELIQYFSHPAIKTGASTTTTTTTTAKDQREWLNKIFAILRSNIGHDFSAYKTNTILRRIGRRMGLNQIDSRNTYVRYLRENPSEVEALFRELLIGVTRFFRDVDSYEILKSDILPELFESLQEDQTFRVWVPGCSTGEEVYSLAMVFREVLDKNPTRINLQLFGTDIDNFAIDKAREGLFPASISEDVSKERLKRFFTKADDFFRIRKEIRDAVVFSVQDVLKDSPFSRLNMLCCRNLLIYLDTEAQKKLLPLFHYTLNPGRILMLGSSETIGGFGGLFRTLDKKWKIFRRRETPNNLRHLVDFPSGPSTVASPGEQSPVTPAARPADIELSTQKAVLNQFAPTAVLVDSRGEILNVQGRTGKYLEQPSGPPTNNILDLAREGLRIELSSALRAAKSSSIQVTRRRLVIKTNGDTQMIHLHIRPQQSPPELAGHFLVVFEEIGADSDSVNRDVDANASGRFEESRISELERELQVTRESHQTTIEELESSNEELKSTNEEMQSSNEELQSTNEELESSKEELQSLNEELQTLNAELQNKVEELSAAHDDMRNLLNSTEIATIFVDNDLRIRRFTQKTTEIVNLIQTDVGRPLNQIVNNLKRDMIADITEVNTKLIPKQVTVEASSGQWFNMNIIPYRTTDNRIDGTVITFIDITDQKNAQMLAEQMKELVRAVFDLNPDPLVVLDDAGKMVIANTAFSLLMEIDQNDIQGRDIDIIQQKTKQKIGLKNKLLKALKQAENFKTVTFSMATGEAQRKFCIQGDTIQLGSNFPYRILLRLTAR